MVEMTLLGKSSGLEGLFVSQYGDIKHKIESSDGEVTTMEEFLRDYFGFKHDFLWVVVVVIVSVAFPVAFCLTFL